MKLHSKKSGFPFTDQMVLSKPGSGVALVAGATRGAGRAIAIELASAGMKVYVTGRSSGDKRSNMNRPETIEETAQMITARGGQAVAIQVDHTRVDEVTRLAEQIESDNDGQIDLLVNDVWGGDPFTVWDKPFWEQDLGVGLAMLNNAVTSHLITSHAIVPLMVRRRRGLVIEVTDGVTHRWRGSFYYDLAKAAVNRLALGQAAELKPHGVVALALSPGFLRSEAMLDHFGVSESNWRDAIQKSRDFAVSETPYFIGRAVVALMRDPHVSSRAGKVFATWNLAREYGFTDVDGTQPHWGDYARQVLGLDMG